MINKNYIYALVGASNNPEKFGYKVFKDLLEKGYQIFPVNPKWGELLEQKVFTNLDEIVNKKNMLDVVIFVTPPSISLQILETVNKLGIKKVWFQPGASDENCLNFCKEHTIEEIHDACMMLRG